MAGSVEVRRANAEAARQRRLKEQLAARRQNQSRAGENIGALGSGVASIPRRVVNYIKTSTPSGVAQDVKDVFSSTYEAAKEDPGQFAADAIFSPLAAIRDFGDVRAKARKLREQGRNAEAEKLEAMAGVSVLSAIPVVGRVAGTAVRNAEKGALRGAVRAAAKGPANPLHEISLEFGSDIARRLDGIIPPDAPISEWRQAAARLAGSDVPNSVQPRPSTYSVRPADVATDPRIESRKGELGKIANLELEVSPRVTDPAPKVSIFDYEGHPYITSMSDLAAAGDDLLSVNGVKFRVPFSRRGGQGYMFDNPGSVWASERTPAETHVDLANRLQQMTGKDVLFMPWTMGPNAVKFSHMPRGIQYSYADAALGGADRNALAADIKSILPDWRGFEDPDSAEMFMTVTGKARGALNTLMDKYRTRGGLGMGEAVYAATDLDQMNTPLTTLRNVGIIDPKYGASPSSHASYNFSVPGRGEGVLEEEIGALGLSPDVMAALGYETPFDFPVGVQPGTKSPLRAMQMKPQGGVLDYKVLRFLDDLLKGKK